MQNTIKVGDVYFILHFYHDSIVGVHLKDALHFNDTDGIQYWTGQKEMIELLMHDFDVDSPDSWINRIYNLRAGDEV
jgi:hypothetical protein